MRPMDGNDHFRFLTRTCESCLDALLGSRGETLSRYLESLDQPAALVAADHTVLFANRPFRGIDVGGDVLGLRVGQVLGCMYSPLLGACGETVTCILCALRRSIEETCRTGQGLRGVQIAYPHRQDVRRAFSVTTQKAGDAVLVMLESPAAATP